jgi:uncharacterized protein (DUF2384 family)
VSEYHFLPGDVALPFGLDPDGKLVSVEEVMRGLSCDCVCPGCGAPLVAKKGTIIRHHFAHAGDASCATGFESMLHLLAKEIIAEKQRITVPAVSVSVGLTSKLVSAGRVLTLTNVRLEKWLNGLRPDIIADFNGHDLIIEVAVTHKSPPEKIEELRKRGAPAIEIDLSSLHRRMIDRALVSGFVIDTAPRVWLFNRLHSQAMVEATATEFARMEAERQRELTLVQENARLLAAWASFEESQIGARDAEERAVGAKREERARQFAFEKNLLVGEVTPTMGEDDAIAWVDRQTSSPLAQQIATDPAVDMTGFWIECRHSLDRDLARHTSRQTAAGEARDSLLRAAVARFRDRDKAELWMRTTNPRIGMQRPIDACLKSNGVDLCKAALGASK